MKNLSILLALALLVPAAAHANPFTGFSSNVTQDLIKPFALDLGGLLGGANFYDGRALGFPGFRLDVLGVVQSNPDKNDLIMRNANVKAFGFPMLEAAVGLPGKVDVTVHGIEADHVSTFGGGLRYGLYKSGLIDKMIPNVGVGAYGDKVNYSAFKATHFGLEAAASWSLPIVSPFVSAGVDVTRVVVGAAANPALSAAANAGLVSTSATAAGSRFMGGVDFTPFPFARVHAAFMLLHGATGGNFGLGLQF